MRRNTFLVIILLLSFAASLGYLKYFVAHRQSSPAQEVQASPLASSAPIKTPQPAVNAITQLLQSLTAQQRILQLIAYPITVKNLPSMPSRQCTIFGRWIQNVCNG